MSHETTLAVNCPEDAGFDYWLACARELVAREDLEAIIVLAADSQGRMSWPLPRHPAEAPI